MPNGLYRHCFWIMAKGLATYVVYGSTAKNALSYYQRELTAPDEKPANPSDHPSASPEWSKLAPSAASQVFCSSEIKSSNVFD